MHVVEHDRRRHRQQQHPPDPGDLRLRLRGELPDRRRTALDHRSSTSRRSGFAFRSCRASRSWCSFSCRSWRLGRSCRSRADLLLAGGPSCFSGPRRLLLSLLPLRPFLPRRPFTRRRWWRYRGGVDPGARRHFGDHHLGGNALVAQEPRERAAPVRERREQHLRLEGSLTRAARLEEAPGMRGERHPFGLGCVTPHPDALLPVLQHGRQRGAVDAGGIEG